jgi:hypothetical protein
MSQEQVDSPASADTISEIGQDELLAFYDYPAEH